MAIRNVWNNITQNWMSLRTQAKDCSTIRMDFDNVESYLFITKLGEHLSKVLFSSTENNFKTLKNYLNCQWKWFEFKT